MAGDIPQNIGADLFNRGVMGGGGNSVMAGKALWGFLADTPGFGQMFSPQMIMPKWLTQPIPMVPGKSEKPGIIADIKKALGIQRGPMPALANSMPHEHVGQISAPLPTPSRGGGNIELA